MSDLSLVVVGVPILLALVIVAWFVKVGRQRASWLVIDEVAYPGLARLRSATLVSRRVGLVLGLAACVLMVPLGELGRFTLAGPPVAGIVAIIAILAGQYSAHRAALTPGVAGLERRSWTHYPNRRAVGEVVGALAVVALVAGYTTSQASADDMGRVGRALRTVCSVTVWTEGVTSEHLETSTSSPFPGSFYTVPLAVAVGLLVLATLIAGIQVGRRPRDGSDAELVRVDDALRRMTAEGIVASAGLGLSGSLLLVSASAYQQFGHAPCTVSNVASSYVLAAVALGALVFALRSFVVILVPGDGAQS